jgi:hypothetical protein
MADFKKIGVTHHYQTLVESQDQWNQPFNSLLFINYNTVSPVYINSDLIIPAAMLIADVVGNKLVPATHEISLNITEVNTTNFKIDFRGAADPHLVLSWTEYP